MSKKIISFLIVISMLSSSCTSYRKKSGADEDSGADQESYSWPEPESNLWKIPERGIR